MKDGHLTESDPKSITAALRCRKSESKHKFSLSNRDAEDELVGCLPAYTTNLRSCPI